MKRIYDFGAKDGADLAYYLLKADQVIAIEANPALVREIEGRYASEIGEGTLIVVGCVVTVDEDGATVPFYIHKTNLALSQFPRPADARLAQFDEVTLPARNVVSLIQQYGEPYFIKIDIEHYDHVVLRALFDAGIKPPYISAESHAIEVFALMVAMGGYRAFKIVDGGSVGQRFSSCSIETGSGPRVHKFAKHTAGPFGDDIPGPWMTGDNFFALLGALGLGWRDIHASRLDEPDPAHAPRVRHSVKSEISY